MCLVKNDGVRVKPKVPNSEYGSGRLQGKRITPAFKRLMTAVQQLERVAENNVEGANKDLAKFTDQILELCRKWNR